MRDAVIKVEDLGKRYRIQDVTRSRTIRGWVDYAIGRQLGLLFRNLPPGAGRPKRSSGHSPEYAVDREGDFWALKDVSFEVFEGQILGILGRNGSGKSTLLKILAGLTEPSAGFAEMRGKVAAVLEVGTGFHPELTGRENVFLSGSILGMRRAEIERRLPEIVEFSEIGAFLDMPVRVYSSGMYVRLAFAVAAHLDADILLLDEVLAVGDAGFQRKCMGRMRELAGQGKTILFVSHNLPVVQALCPNSLLLEGGRAVVRGPTETVLTRYFTAQGRDGKDMCNKCPVFSSTREVSLHRCDVELTTTAGVATGQEPRIDLRTLRIRMLIGIAKGTTGLGVGVSIRTLGWTPVATLSPAITGFILPDGQEDYKLVECEVEIPEVNRYLAGGIYLISVWISRPGVAYLIKLDDFHAIHVPGIDLYGTGVEVEADRHGLVPLRAYFRWNRHS